MLALHAAFDRAVIDRAVATLGAGGPWLFYGAMALLPAVGVPMSAFSLAAGPVFRARLGLAGVVMAGFAATVTNLTLTYLLARGALRPWLQKLMVRLGHRLPQVEQGDAGDLILITRVSPVPFFAKNYLLGLANAPMGKYLLISCVIEGFYTSSFCLFGDALLHGKGRTIFLIAVVIVIAVAATHLARRHFAGRKLANERAG